MFSGIVETTGEISRLVTSGGCKDFTISPSLPFNDIVIGESIAVNGVCLTVTGFTSSGFNVTAVPETLRLTNLDQLISGSAVNLERSLKLNSRLGGHVVQGHVDGTGQIMELAHDDSDALMVKISLPDILAKYIVNKGYITLDGMSITVIQAANTWFTVTLIPHTREVTIAHQYTVGSKINIEVDILGKYVEKMLGAYKHAISH
ncbi:Riboflavin synthase [Aquicella siphonis]|uniref:Riboflavin synthase n=1 Tax=Aquicella siphonis TaxID=254247 RepID=A0A5E4PKF8_9COXI|nr:riboflavin synthase [Aquicella siphonis]VVC77035.1 Riboflavin synthase [Aquicella siphonis]